MLTRPPLAESLGRRKIYHRTGIHFDSYKMNLIFLCFIGLMTSISVYGEPLAGSKNVCNTTKIVLKIQRVEEPRVYATKSGSKCGLLDCDVKKEVVKLDSSFKTVPVQVEVAECCPGYTEGPDRLCKPICLRSCVHGRCARPNFCECRPSPNGTSPGYVGSTCSMFTCMAADRWGTSCERECSCPANSYCRASDGKCICQQGFKGIDCSMECDPLDNCEDIDLSFLDAPDANFMHEFTGHSQKLQVDKSPEKESEQDSPRTYYAPISTNFLVGIILFLLIIVCTLIFYIFCKKTQDKSNSTNDDLDASTYYSSSVYSDLSSRPRLPTPPEANFLSKNMNFSAATSHILTKPLLLQDNLATHLFDHKTEMHLINSQQPSQKNLYTAASHGISNPDLTTVITPEGHYQVPKSPATLSEFKSASTIRNDDKERIYEEIDIQPRRD